MSIVLYKNKSLVFYYKIVHCIYEYSPFLLHVVFKSLANWKFPGDGTGVEDEKNRKFAYISSSAI